MADEQELREASSDSGGGDGEPLQESAFTVTMSAVGGAGGLAGFGSLYYARAQYRLDRADRDAEQQALRVELEARYEAERRALDIEYRRLYAELHGLDALDRIDGFGPEDGNFDGFEVE